MPYQYKNRIALAVTLLVLSLMLIVSWLGFTFFERRFHQASLVHMGNTLAVTAKEFQGTFTHAQQVLESIAEDLPREILDEPIRVQSFLDQQNAGRLTFDNGIVFFSREGVLQAVNPFQPDVIGKDFSFRDYYRITAENRQPYLSEPFVSMQQHQHPIIMMTEPILGPDGGFLAILGGSIDLLGNNFLGHLLLGHVGERGYFVLFDQDGTIVIHPDTSLILRPGHEALPQFNFDELLINSRGYFENVNVAGEEMLGVYQHLSPSGWTLMALYPVDEIYGPFNNARIYVIFGLVLFAGLIILFVRVMTNRLTAPLQTMSGQVRSLIEHPEMFEPAPMEKFEELGELADSIKLLMKDVTQKRKGLNDQLSFLQNLLDTIPSPIFYKDAEFRYLGCNKAFEAYIGIPREELVGMTPFDLAPPDLAKVYLAADQELWDSEEEQVYEASVKYADGSAHDVIFYKKVFMDADGQKAGLIGTFLDITDRKVSERALQVSEKRFRLLVESAADAFYLHDGEGRILDVNLQACQSLGYSRDELLNMHVRDLSVDFQDREVAALQNKLKLSQTATIEDRHRRKDGTVFPVEVRLCYNEQEGGVTIALARDVSERKRYEERLRNALADAHATGEELANILRSVADGLIVTDRQNRVIHINHVAEQMAGVSAETVAGKRFPSLFGSKALKQQARKFILMDDLENRQYDFHLVDEETKFSRIIQARSSVMLSSSGRRTGLVTILRDVTRERELDQLKSEFISTAAHELRTPMSVIMGYTELLLSTDDYGSFSIEQQVDFLREILRKGEALSLIIDDLFDISRIEAGLPLPLDRVECCVNAIVREVVKRFEDHSQKHRFVTELAENTQVVADCSKLTQVLENLVSNAVKYSPEGGSVAIRTTSDNSLIMVLIEDEGIGMTSSQVERMFDKFYRADSSNTAIGGLGIGMSIVRAIIEGHGGQIWVESECGEGTRVFFTIPIDADGEDAIRIS